MRPAKFWLSLVLLLAFCATAPAQTRWATYTNARFGTSVDYPADLFSLSHVALPFPPDDTLYGQYPGNQENFGIHLGTLTPRGERGVLIVGLDLFQRVTSNPFYGYLVQRIDQQLAGQGSTAH